MDHPSPSFDATNAEHITFAHGVIEMAVLGGIRLEGLERLRVTLKIQVEHLALRHNLDLYNDNQVERLVRKVAERLEVGTSVITAALMQLTELLEQYRLTEIERQATSRDERKFLSSEEIKEATVYLSAPNLMKRTGEDIGRAGVVGEELNRLLMYLIFTSRKREHPLHVVSLGISGIGKTYLQEKVGALIPEEDKIEITSLSENAFYYFGQWQLRNKLILIEDMDGAEGVLYPLRELQTKRKISKTVVHKNTKGETRTVHLKVEGPVSIAGCTTKESLYEDNANRSFLIYIDESAQQDERIMDYQRKISAGKIDQGEEAKITGQLKNLQRILLPVTIRNPFAEQLKIPTEVLKPRRTNAHYLAFIEVVTFFHQYQREKQYDAVTGEEFIETTLQDIKAANGLMKDVLLRKSDVLPGAVRTYFEKLKGYLKSKEQPTYTNREIRNRFRIPGTTLKRYQAELLASGLIRIKAGKKATGYAYEIISYADYEDLKSSVATVLDDIFHKIGQARSVKRRSSGPVVDQGQNGPLKHKKAS